MAVPFAPWPAATTTRLLAGFGAAAAFACVALVGSLEVLSPAADVLHSMISDLVFGPDPWLFDRDFDEIWADRLQIRTQPKAVMAGLDPWASTRFMRLSSVQKRRGLPCHAW